mgnify:CR=1 FL=1
MTLISRFKTVLLLYLIKRIPNTFKFGFKLFWILVIVSFSAPINCKYYDLISSDRRLTNIEVAEDVDPMLLKNVIGSLKAYDFIVIDTPPALGNLSYTSLIASVSTPLA